MSPEGRRQRVCRNPTRVGPLGLVFEEVGAGELELVGGEAGYLIDPGAVKGIELLDRVRTVQLVGLLPKLILRRVDRNLDTGQAVLATNP